jgi:hypothetical protein
LPLFDEVDVFAFCRRSVIEETTSGDLETPSSDDGGVSG